MPLGEIENHPYLDYLGPNPDYSIYQNLIIGSFPIYAITDSLATASGIQIRAAAKIKGVMYYFYGSTDNYFWEWLFKIFKDEILKDFNKEDCMKLLNEFDFMITDIIKSCERKDYSSLDSDLKNPKLNAEVYKMILTMKGSNIYFTSTKTGKPFMKFLSLLKKASPFQLTPIGNSTNYILSLEGREYNLGLLNSPSPNGKRAQNKNQSFSKYKIKNKAGKYVDFVLEQWQQLLVKKNFAYDGTNPIL